MTTDDAEPGFETAELPNRNKPKPPYIRREVILWSPTAENKPAGFVGKDTNNGRVVYTSRRFDHHYYREGGGYAVSDILLARARKYDASRVIIHEAHTHDVHEFLMDDYMNREVFEDIPEDYLMDPDDTQRYVPDGRAVETWEDHAESMFHQRFSNAMDRITARRGYGD